MRRTWLIALAAICISGSAVCAYLARPQVPRTLVAVNSLYEVGEVGQGETKTVEFELVNHFSGAVKIEKVDASCACTNVDFPRRALAPGEKVIVKADWRTGTARGKRVTDLTVFFKPEGEPAGQTQLRIQGIVAPDMLYSPEKLEFKKGVPASKAVFFTAGRMTDGELKKASCTHHAFTAALGKATNEVTVTYNPAKWTVDDDNVPLGAIGLLQVETTSPHEPVCYLPLVVGETKAEK